MTRYYPGTVWYVRWSSYYGDWGIHKFQESVIPKRVHDRMYDGAFGFWIKERIKKKFGPSGVITINELWTDDEARYQKWKAELKADRG